MILYYETDKLFCRYKCLLFDLRSFQIMLKKLEPCIETGGLH